MFKFILAYTETVEWTIKKTNNIFSIYDYLCLKNCPFSYFIL